LDYFEEPFDLGLLVAFDATLAATLAVDYILDDMSQGAARQVYISQSTTVITVNDSGPPIPTAYGGGLGHGLQVGDAVELTGTPGVDGIYAVATVPSISTYTLTAASGTIAGAQCQVVSGRVMTGAAAGGADGVIKVAPVTTRTSINVTCPIYMARLRATAFTTGGIGALVALQGSKSS
jgi:hypothetical protein